MFNIQTACVEPFSALELNYDVTYNPKKDLSKILIIEECKIGKNINIKFKDTLEKGH